MADDAAFGFSVDTAALAEAAKKAEEAAKSFKEMGKGAEEGGDGVDKATDKVKASTKVIKEHTEAVKQNAQAQQQASQVKPYVPPSAGQGFPDGYGGFFSSPQAAEASKQRWIQLKGGAASAPPKPAGASAGVAAPAEAAGAIRAIGGAAGEAEAAVGGLTGGMGLLGGAATMLMGILGPAAVGGALVAFGRHVYENTEALELLDRRFKAITGSAADAKRVLEDADRIGERTGSRRITRENIGTFLSEGAGVGREEATRYTATLEGLNNLSGNQPEQSPALVSAFSRAIKDGNVSLAELEDMTNKAPALLKALGDAMGVPTAAVIEMARQHQLSAGKVTDALDKMAKDVASNVGSQAGIWAQVHESWDQLMEKLATSDTVKGLGDAIGRALKGGIDMASGRDGPGHLSEGFGGSRPVDQRQWAKGSGEAQSLALRYAKKYGLAPEDALTILYNESRGNADTTWHPQAGRPNRQGDPYGVMGVSAAAMQDVGMDPSRRFSLAGNIEGGIAYGALQIKRAGGNRVEGLRRYHAGTTGVRGAVNDQYVAGMTIEQARNSAGPGRDAHIRDLEDLVARLEASSDPNDQRLAAEKRRELEQARAGYDEFLHPQTPFLTYQQGIDASVLGDAGIGQESSRLAASQRRSGNGGTLGQATALVRSRRVLDVQQATVNQNFRASQTGLLAGAQAGGPEAVRLAGIDQSVREEEFSRFGLKGATTSEERKALDEFRKSVTAASEATQKLAEAQRVAGLNISNEAAQRRLGVGGGNGLVLFGRSEALRDLRRNNPNASTAELEQSFRLSDANALRDSVVGLGEGFDDLADQQAINNLPISRRRTARAGQAVAKRLGDTTDLSKDQIDTVRRFAEALEDARVKVEEYSQAHDDIAGGISGAVGGTMRGLGSSLVRGQMSMKEVDRVLSEQIAGVADKVIENLWAKPLEKMTGQFADKASTWIISKMGRLSSVDPAAIKTATSMLTAAEAAGMLAKSLTAASAATGASGASSIASTFLNFLGGGAHGTGGSSVNNTMSAPTTVAAHGAVFTLGFGGGVGKLLSRPTYTPLAHGGALAGEVDAEAVLPLKRGPDGKLGVGGGGGGGDVQIVVNDMRGAGGAPVETEHSQGPDGKRMIRMTIRDEVRSGLRTGAQDAPMRDRFGAQPQIVRR